MRKYLKTTLIFFLIFSINFQIIHSSDIEDFFNNLLNNDDNSTKTIAKGLKEALNIGTKRAVKNVSRKNGYFKNNKIKIPLPSKLKKTESILRPIGFGDTFDKFILTMNRAAEKAAPKAVNIFVDSIKQMTITDAVEILNGGDDAATRYFKKKSYNSLYNVFKPIIRKSINKVGVTKHYNKIKNKADNIPVLNDYFVELDDYITQKALEGLFKILAEEEEKIRKNPVKRTTELLQKVFG